MSFELEEVKLRMKIANIKIKTYEAVANTYATAPHPVVAVAMVAAILKAGELELAEANTKLELLKLKKKDVESKESLAILPSLETDSPKRA